MVSSPDRQNPCFLEPGIRTEHLVQCTIFESYMLQSRIAAFIRIGNKPGYFKEHDAMIELIVTHECHPGERRSVRYAGRNLHAIVDRHAQYLAVPVDHGIQVGCSQPVMHQLWMNDNFGIHFICVCDPEASLGSDGRELLSSCQNGKGGLPIEVRTMADGAATLALFCNRGRGTEFPPTADRLHVSHPALSQQIRDLEDELGLKFFERNSRQVELTEIGRVFLVGARRALEAAKQAVTVAQEAAKGERGRLLIGCLGPLVSSFLPNALARFREERPLVEVTVSHMHARAQVEALLDGSIMLGIGYFDTVTDEDERDQLCAQLLVRCPFGVAHSKTRRFATSATPTLKDFRNDKFLCFDQEYAYGHEDLIRGVCRRIGGFSPR